jgi:hypothetical protein
MCVEHFLTWGIKGRNAKHKLCKFIVKGLQEGTEILWIVDYAKADDILKVGAKTRRQVQVLKDDRDRLRAMSSMLKKQITINRETKCNVMQVQKVIVWPIHPIDLHLAIQEIAVMHGVEDITDAAWVMFEAVSISHLLDHGLVLEKRLNLGDERQVLEWASNTSFTGEVGLATKWTLLKEFMFSSVCNARPEAAINFLQLYTSQQPHPTEHHPFWVDIEFVSECMTDLVHQLMSEIAVHLELEHTNVIVIMITDDIVSCWRFYVSVEEVWDDQTHSVTRVLLHLPGPLFLQGPPSSHPEILDLLCWKCLWRKPPLTHSLPTAIPMSVSIE